MMSANDVTLSENKINFLTNAFGKCKNVADVKILTLFCIYSDSNGFINDLSTATLATMVGQAQPNVFVSVKRLEKAGFIEIIPTKKMGGLLEYRLVF